MSYIGSVASRRFVARHNHSGRWRWNVRMAVPRHLNEIIVYRRVFNLNFVFTVIH